MTKEMHPPHFFFPFSALEQLTLSLNHFTAEKLGRYAELPSLKDIILYCPEERGRSTVSFEDEEVAEFRAAKPLVHFSFILAGMKDVVDIVPHHLPLKGLEINRFELEDIRDLSDRPTYISAQHIKEAILPKLRNLQQLAIIEVPVPNERGFLKFVEHCFLEAGVRHGLLPNLESFQLGGDCPASFYAKMAGYISRLSPRLHEWLLYFDDKTTFGRGPHSVLSHNSRRNVDASRLGTADCDAPPDDKWPMKCSASDAGSLYRCLKRALGPESGVELRLMSKHHFLGTSLFWTGHDPRVLREMRTDGVLARDLPPEPVRL